MPSEQTARIVSALADRGYNVEREAATLLARAPDPERAVDRAVETVPDDALVVSAEHVRRALDGDSLSGGRAPPEPSDDVRTGGRTPPQAPDADTGEPDETTAAPSPPVSGGAELPEPPDDERDTPVETGGSGGDSAPAGTDSVPAGVNSTSAGASSTETDSSQTDTGSTSSTDGRTAPPASGPSMSGSDRSARAGRDGGSTAIEVSGDIQSTGTGDYGDFVDVFRDRYERLADLLRGRVNHRPASTVADLSDGSETGLVGMVADAYTTSGGHLRLELEDTTGTYPCLVLNDREVIDQARTVLHDEVVAVEGRVSRDGGDDGGVLFVNDLYFPDVPHTYSPSTADRPVRAALVSDVHVGSEEFRPDAWQRFADWLHSEEAADVEYLLVAGDMVEGVGVYPGQDEELDIVDIYDQYERFSEHLKDVPGDMEIVMIPGNHDAVRLAEPQPAFDEELREIMSAHDATISANPSTVTIEGVSVLMYHGVALDELIAELPDAAYECPAETMTHLLRKRHLAPQYGGQVRIAPEEKDHLVVDEVPDIFHAGHVHKFGYTRDRGVLTVNSSCWQSQTGFQESVNLDPDVAYAPVVDLQTLDLQYAQFV